MSGKGIMAIVVIFGLAMILILNGDHSKRDYFFVALQLLIGLIVIVAIPIQILELSLFID